MPLNVPERVKLRIEDFMLLEAAGAFAAIHKTELIDGELFGVNSQHRPHSRAKFRLARALEDALSLIGSPLGVLIEATVEMPPHDLPEPDIVVTSAPTGKGFVPRDSVALLVEVADTTLGFDMRQKALLYARHGIAEYWVVDLNAEKISRMWQPSAAGFAEADETSFGVALVAATILGLTVATDRLT